jgi:hypothetical protein
MKKDHGRWTRLVNSFIPTLQEEPLWGLQKIGKENIDFLYGPMPDSRSIQSRPGVAYCSRKFCVLIQQIIQSALLRAVRNINGEVLGEQIDLSRVPIPFRAKRFAYHSSNPDRPAESNCIACAAPSKRLDMHCVLGM